MKIKTLSFYSYMKILDNPYLSSGDTSIHPLASLSKMVAINHRWLFKF